jgi:sulfopyruvate decarboxylase subunit alpha
MLSGQSSDDTDTRQDSMASGPELIVAGLREAGIDLVATLPDWKLQEVIRLVEAEPAWLHVPLCREEEGVGICAGAYMTGKKVALIMQNGGLLNSVNGLTTTALQYGIPMLLLIYYAGDLGDRWFSTVGSVTEPVLDALRIRYYLPRELDAIQPTLRKAQILAEDSNRPVGVLLTRDILQI